MPTARRTTRVRLTGRPATSTPNTPPPPRPVDVYRAALDAAHHASVDLYRRTVDPALDAATADALRALAEDVARIAAVVESLDNGDPYGPRRLLSPLADVGSFFRFRADAVGGTLPPL